MKHTRGRRTAPNLQLYSVRDALRSLIVWGFDKLSQQPMVASMLNLGDLYVSVILASKALGIRLRPELKPGETFATDAEIAAAVLDGALEDPTKMMLLFFKHRSDVAPQALLDDIVKTVQDRYLGQGGAGFASQVAHRGSELFDRALTLMKTCPEDCDASCYRCLRSFKNKFEHGLLDRHVGAELLDYLISGEMQPFNARRIRASSRLLHQDLERQTDGITFAANEEVSVPGLGPVTIPILATRPDGKRFAIALAGALTGDHPADPAIASMRERWGEIPVVPVNELLVRGNLPAATRNVQSALGQ